MHFVAKKRWNFKWKSMIKLNSKLIYLNRFASANLEFTIIYAPATSLSYLTVPEVHQHWMLVHSKPPDAEPFRFHHCLCQYWVHCQLRYWINRFRRIRCRVDCVYSAQVQCQRWLRWSRSVILDRKDIQLSLPFLSKITRLDHLHPFDVIWIDDRRNWA